MVKVNWTGNAIEDVNAIAEFIAKDSLKYAEIQVNRFFEIVELLKKNIRLGRVVPELNNNDIRELISGNYRLVYFVKNEFRVDIITIHNSNRLIKNNPNL